MLYFVSNESFLTLLLREEIEEIPLFYRSCTVKTQDLVHLPHVLVQAWAGKSQFSTGVWAELGSTHIRVLKHDANVLKHES